MKKLLFFIFIFSLISVSTEAKPFSKNNGKSHYLPFAPKGKHGKLRTKQAKRVKQKEAWIYRQWKRC